MVERSLSLQIGEPRLDTGLVPQEYLRPPFDPITPLLPEEVCWILDRAMAFEVNSYISIMRSSNPDFYTIHTDRIPLWKLPPTYRSYFALHSPP